MEAEMKSQGWKTKHEGNGYYYQLNADMSHFPSETESNKNITYNLSLIDSNNGMNYTLTLQQGKSNVK